MAMKARVRRATMGMQGRVTLPIEVRRELQLAAGAEFEVEVVDGRIVFSPADPFPREDAWAYTPEHRTLVARARQDVAEGRVYRLGRDELGAMIADADARRELCVQTGLVEELYVDQE